VRHAVRHRLIPPRNWYHENFSDSTEIRTIPI
jgi:hypothetical protein